MAEIDEENALYVGDLHSSVTEEMLRHTFSNLEGFKSYCLCKTMNGTSVTSLGYGYVNFDTHENAMKALQSKNYTILGGKELRIMPSRRNSSEFLRSGIGNVFVKNLDSEMTSSKLHAAFQKYGNILSCKVAVDDRTGKCKGYGYVQFLTQESANDAIKYGPDDETYIGPVLIVTKFVPTYQRMRSQNEDDIVYTKIYIKNLADSVTEEVLWQVCNDHGGKVNSFFLPKHPNGVIKGFALVDFENPEDAKKAKMGLHGKDLDGKVLYVARAQTKRERSEQNARKNPGFTTQGRNLYVRNIDLRATDKQLEQFFSEHGRVGSAIIVRSKGGMSKGVGFVCFMTQREASLAIRKLNGVVFCGKPIYLSYALSEEEKMRQRWQGFVPYGQQQQQQQPVSEPDPVYMIPAWFDDETQQQVYQPVHIYSMIDGQQRRVLYQQVCISGLGPVSEEPIINPMQQSYGPEQPVPQQVPQQQYVVPTMGQEYVQQQPLYQPENEGGQWYQPQNPMGVYVPQQQHAVPMGQEYVQQQQFYQPVNVGGQWYVPQIVYHPISTEEELHAWQQQQVPQPAVVETQQQAQAQVQVEVDQQTQAQVQVEAEQQTQGRVEEERHVSQPLNPMKEEQQAEVTIQFGTFSPKAVSR